MCFDCDYGLTAILERRINSETFNSELLKVSLLKYLGLVSGPDAGLPNCVKL